MHFIADDAFWNLFPCALIGAIVVRGIDNQANAEGCATILQSRLERVVADLGETEIGSLPSIIPWRSAYQAFGVKPSKYKSSIEALLRSAKAGRLRSINPLVDFYNAVSLTYQLPCGGEDLAAIVGPIRLTRAIGDEAFVPLGGNESESPPAGAVIYRDDLGVVCSCWNWREADRTKLTENTTDAFLCIEALPPTTAATLRTACDELASLVTEQLGGTAVVEIIDATRRSFAS
jgi:DNA/RNA-binding domain of Phe-tRNA-synthetase-like protein